jgi:hypothetical protein
MWGTIGLRTRYQDLAAGTMYPIISLEAWGIFRRIWAELKGGLLIVLSCFERLFERNQIPRPIRRYGLLPMSFRGTLCRGKSSYPLLKIFQNTVDIRLDIGGGSVSVAYRSCKGSSTGESGTTQEGKRRL